MNSGATWGKWDLHIHTPASYEWRGKRLRDAIDAAERDVLLRAVVESINASGCVAVGVMDYWTFDGIVALREYLATPGSKRCKATIFPGIELRMVSPGDFRLNVHVLLNPELSVEKLTAFKAQLKLAITGKPLSDDYLVEFGREHISPDELGKLGTSKQAVQEDRAAALIAACKRVEITPTSVVEALKVVGERDAILFVPFDTNDGVNKIRFREHYAYPREILAMEAIFEVSNQSTRDAFAGHKTTGNQAYFAEFQDAIKHPKLAVRGSDAHSIDDYGKFPNGRVTWIKAHATFAGLLQACREPANRSFVGEIPPKVDFVEKHPHLFIKTIRIRRRAGAPEPGTWFDGTELRLNHDLVALIGRKGSGKSALADVIGLLGDTPNERYFSFLSDRRFRLPKDNKASSFEAQLEWEQDTKTLAWRGLAEPRAASTVQRVKYLPQSYFEEVCNDHVRGDDYLLQHELRAVIFSHISSEERQGAESLDEIINSRTETIGRDAVAFQSLLRGLNARVLQLSALVEQDARRKLREEVRLELLGLKALRDKKPVVVSVPPMDDVASQGATAAISKLNGEIANLEQKHTTTRAEVEVLRNKVRNIDDAVERLASLARTVTEQRQDLDKRLMSLGLTADDIVKFTVDGSSLGSLRENSARQLSAKQELLLATNPQSLHARLSALQVQLRAEQDKLDGPLRQHQESLALARSWEVEWANAVGVSDKDDSFRGKWNKLKALPGLREELSELRERRRQVSVGILGTLNRRADVLKSLFAPVQALVDDEPEIREALGVRFSVRFSFDAFATRLFDFIKQNAGSFVGLEESRALAAKLLAGYDLTQADGLTQFLEAAEHALTHDIRSGSSDRAIAASALLRADRTLNELYDFLFGLEYADLSYGLMLGSVELERLSPGQRGALLLIFYLLVDRERIPILLDQPEENLDNETVYQLLVGVITRAKQHRQVIMVTHNANLAVACDAEQVVVCTMERGSTNRISYTAGSIEEFHLNKSVVDILEGTKPAFENRRRKYL